MAFKPSAYVSHQSIPTNLPYSKNKRQNVLGVGPEESLVTQCARYFRRNRIVKINQTYLNRSVDLPCKACRFSKLTVDVSNGSLAMAKASLKLRWNCLFLRYKNNSTKFQVVPLPLVGLHA